MAGRLCVELQTFFFLVCRSQHNPGNVSGEQTKFKLRHAVFPVPRGILGPTEAGMDREILGSNSHFEVEDLQAITSGWRTPLCAGWESTKNFRDTGEMIGLVMLHDQERARKELNELSEACPSSEEDASDDEGFDGEWGEHRAVPRGRWERWTASLYTKGSASPHCD